MKFIFLRIVIFPEVILKQLKSEGLTLSGFIISTSEIILISYEVTSVM